MRELNTQRKMLKIEKRLEIEKNGRLFGIVLELL